MRISSPCPHQSEVAAYLSDEQAGEAKVFFAEHLATCSHCQQEVAETRGMLAQLRRFPEATVSPDFATRVLAQVETDRESQFSSHWWSAPLLSWAAVFALLLTAAGIWSGRREHGIASQVQPVAAKGAGAAAKTHEELMASMLEAHAWLYAAQEPDGSWSATRWGGDRRFQPALTALPLLALLQSPTPATSEQSAALARAVENLCRLQGTDGAFGPTFQAAPYNQGIVTLALLHAYVHTPGPALKRTLEASLELIVQRQTADGGWGYLYTPMANRSVSRWHIECLRTARELGWAQAQNPLERGLAWQAHHAELDSVDEEQEAGETDESPSREVAEVAGSDDSTMGSLDYSQIYFQAARLRNGTDEASQQQLATLRQTLRMAQVRTGAFSGSWGLDDRWSRVGGRLYTTALASLALK